MWSDSLLHVSALSFRDTRRAPVFRFELFGTPRGATARAAPGAAFATSFGMPRPLLRLIKNTDRSAPRPLPMGELLGVRLDIVQIELGSQKDHASVRRELGVLCDKANALIREIDRGNADWVVDACFTARVRVAEAARLLVANARPDDVRAARATLYRSIAGLVEALEAPVSAPRERDLYLAHLRTLVVAASEANPTDAGWILDIADAELDLCASASALKSVSSDAFHRLSNLRNEIGRWNRLGRPERIASTLVHSILDMTDTREAKVGS